MLYRGCHKTNNLNDGYLGSGTVLKRAIKKYGKENFQRITLEYCSNEEEMYEREKIYVDNIFIHSKQSYNLRCGGLGGRLKAHILKIIADKLRVPKSEQTKQRMRASQLGKHHSEQTKQKMRESQTGKITSDEAKQKQSEKAKNRSGNANGTKWIHNGIICKRINKEYVLEEGWSEGRIKVMSL
jgi:group I intron endonuclease